MDAHLKLLADASLAVSEAEESISDGAWHRASERLDEAREALAGLRERWGGMGSAERRVVGAAAKPVRARLDAASGRVPRLRPVSEVPRAEAVADPEQEADPEAA